MSIDNNRDFDDFLKSKADGFHLKPRANAFEKVKAGVSKYQFIQRTFNILVFVFITTLPYYIFNSKNAGLSFGNKISKKIESPLAKLIPNKNQIQELFSPKLHSQQASNLYRDIEPIDAQLLNNIYHQEESASPMGEMNQLELNLQHKRLDFMSVQTLVPKKVAIKPIPKAPSHWKWSVFSSTGISFRKLTYASSAESNPHSFTNKDGFDWKQHQAIIGFVAGVSLEKQVSKSIYIKSGLQFYLGGYDIQNKFLTYNVSSNPNLKAEEKDEYIKSSYRVAFVEMPMLVGYLKPLRHGNFKIDGGLTLSARVFEQTPVSAGLLGKEYTVWNGDTRAVNISVQSSPSFSFKYKGLHLNTGVEMRYQLTSTYIKSYPVKEHLYFVGMKLGIGI